MPFKLRSGHARSGRLELSRLCLFAAALFAALTSGSSALTPQPPADIALIVSVDVSSSVDQRRYAMQMEGIAGALEDPSVFAALVGGPNERTLFTMVTWANTPKIAVPWTPIATREDALAIAAAIRQLPQFSGGFTCLASMMQFVSERVVKRLPAKATKIVLDVSGDGPDDCNNDDLLKFQHDTLIDQGVTINGLPIKDGPDADMIEQWYRDHVIGGMGSFAIAAHGYSDFKRAVRQKFVTEISSLP
jgi:hypothetical protein